MGKNLFQIQIQIVFKVADLPWVCYYDLVPQVWPSEPNQDRQLAGKMSSCLQAIKDTGHWLWKWCPVTWPGTVKLANCWMLHVSLNTQLFWYHFFAGWEGIWRFNGCGLLWGSYRTCKTMCKNGRNHCETFSKCAAARYWDLGFRTLMGS